MICFGEFGKNRTGQKKSRAMNRQKSHVLEGLDGRVTCATCLKAEDLCVCSWIKPVATKTHVLILQHPQEPDKNLGSAQIAHLSLPKSTLRVGLSWPNLSAALGQEAKVKEWIVFYLGSVRPDKAAVDPPAPFLLSDRQGSLRAASSAVCRTIKGMVFLDGTWSQAKTLWWRNAWLLKLQRAVLAPPRPSLYCQLRKEPRPEGLSTIEAIALGLSSIEAKPEIEEALLQPFKKLLQAYRRRGV